VRTVTVSAPPAASGDLRYYGHIVSLRRSADRYLLRFDPEWFLSGLTANVAAAEDQGISCAPAACEAVPNDNYRVDEGKRVLTFFIRPGIRGTVLAADAANNVAGRSITASRLAQIVDGSRPLKLFEPLSTGFWILVHVDTVVSFEQQYIP
jgi:hypothetical protein